jgi:hypothetical protein
MFVCSLFLAYFFSLGHTYLVPKSGVTVFVADFAARDRFCRRSGFDFAPTAAGLDLYLALLFAHP